MNRRGGRNIMIRIVNFLRKHYKLLFFGLLLIIAMVSYLNYFSYIKWGIGCRPEPGPVEVVVDNFSKPLQVAGYKPATVQKPDYIHGDEFPESVEAVIYASGTAGDLPVEVSVVSTIDGQTWVKATIDGNVVKWQKIQVWNEPKPVHNRDWSLLIAGEWIDGVDVGVGVAFQPWEFQDTRIGFQTVVDLNQDLGDAPDWGSLGVRISREVGIVNVGGYGGYRFGEQAGFSVGISTGISLGI